MLALAVTLRGTSGKNGIPIQHTQVFYPLSGFVTYNNMVLYDGIIRSLDSISVKYYTHVTSEQHVQSELLCCGGMICRRGNSDENSGLSQ